MYHVEFHRFRIEKKQIFFRVSLVWKYQHHETAEDRGEVFNLSHDFLSKQNPEKLKFNGHRRTPNGEYYDPPYASTFPDSVFDGISLKNHFFLKETHAGFDIWHSSVMGCETGGPDNFSVGKL